MTHSMLRVFVNERPLDLPAGADVRAAVHAFDPALDPLLADRIAQVTDGRGLPLAPDAPLTGGSILRVIVSRREPPPPPPRT